MWWDNVGWVNLNFSKILHAQSSPQESIATIMSLLVSDNAFDIVAFSLCLLLTIRIEKYLSVETAIILANIPFRSRGAGAAGDAVSRVSHSNFSERCYTFLPMTKKEIVRSVSEKFNLTQLQTKIIVQCVFDCIADTLVEENRIELRNFGVFEVRKRAARKARNPKTGDEVQVKEKRVVVFKSGKALEDALQNKAKSRKK